MDIYEWLRYGLNFVELLACITGLIYWKKIRHTYWKWFPVYLLVIVLTELSGKYISLVLDNSRLNVAIYQFFGIPIQFLFFTWLFYQYLKNTKERVWAVVGAVIYIACWIADFLYFDTIVFRFQSFSFTVGNIILLVLIIIFFVKFINSDEILKYRSSMMFWVSIGLLVFYLGCLPFFGLWNTIKRYGDVFNVYWIVQMLFNYSMYLFFTVAFIWGKPRS